MFEDITKHEKIKHKYSKKERVKNILMILKGEELSNEGISFLDCIDLNLEKTWDNFVNELKEMINYIEYGGKKDKN